MNQRRWRWAALLATAALLLGACSSSDDDSADDSTDETTEETVELVQDGEGLLASVGCYRLEDDGVQLFEAIDGDYFTILGLPLMGLLGVLRERGALAT